MPSTSESCDHSEDPSLISLSFNTQKGIMTGMQILCALKLKSSTRSFTLSKRISLSSISSFSYFWLRKRSILTRRGNHRPITTRRRRIPAWKSSLEISKPSLQGRRNCLGSSLDHSPISLTLHASSRMRLSNNFGGKGPKLIISLLNCRNV